MDHIPNVSQEWGHSCKGLCVFIGILHTKCGRQLFLPARSQTAARALSTLLLLQDPKSSNKANMTLGKLLYAKNSIRLLWSKKQKEGEGCQAATVVITAISWLGIIGTGKNSFAM